MGSGWPDEDNFSGARLTPELGEASFAGKTSAAAESPAKPRFSQLACSLLLLSEGDCARTACTSLNLTDRSTLGRTKMQNPLSEYNPEMEMFESEQFEWSGETTGEVLGEGELMELAAELLEVRDEQELDRFLGDMLKKVKGAAGGSTGKAVGGVLKGLLKKALPLAGKVAGSFFGGPIGATIGGKLGSMAGNLFEMELEGLSQEDREFEAAKQFVRFASQAAQNASFAPGGNPVAIARSAVAAAAQTHAPGLLNGSAAMSPVSSMSPRSSMPGPSAGFGRPRSGRWRRIGPTKILIENC
jgi:hypothetical protein